MLSMALPIALVGIMSSRALARAPALRPGRQHPAGRRRSRPTARARSSRRSRPSSTLAYFRRRELRAAGAAGRWSCWSRSTLLSPGALGRHRRAAAPDAARRRQHRQRPHRRTTTRSGPTCGPTWPSGAATAATSTRPTGCSTWRCCASSSRSASWAWPPTSCSWSPSWPPRARRSDDEGPTNPGWPSPRRRPPSPSWSSRPSSTSCRSRTVRTSCCGWRGCSRSWSPTSGRRAGAAAPA